MFNLLPFQRTAKGMLFFLFAAHAAIAGPQFLTLPFNNPNVFLRQGWVYDTTGSFTCSDFPLGFQDRCHKGIDYFCVQGNAVTTFDVLSAAPGRAIASYTQNGYGYFVLIAHNETDEQERRIFSLYAHVQKDSWTTTFKTKDQLLADIAAGDFSSWTKIDRGQKVALAGNSGGWPQVHLHFEVQLGGYAVNKADPYDIYGTKNFYPAPCVPSPIFPSDQASGFPDSFWTQCPPVPPQSQGVLQPGPDTGEDIWTTSVYSYAPCSYPGPGGGLYDYELRVGGWGDWYYSLLQFDLTGLPSHAASVTLQLYCYGDNNGNPAPMYLDRITQFWWDWQTAGTGCDHARLWWADRPSAEQWGTAIIPAPIVGQWCSVDITDLYNAWQSGQYANYGVQLRPVYNWDYFDDFYSSRYTLDPTLRPKLVIQP